MSKTAPGKMDAVIKIYDSINTVFYNVTVKRDVFLLFRILLAFRNFLPFECTTDDCIIFPDKRRSW